ncbi:hypothetical protein A9Q98_01585 [Thalassotalea sp. 42_200_T64]|nr:hypothetical protein A9Q98_01585 [Thalassotalea sp. 42_200_T64]
MINIHFSAVILVLLTLISTMLAQSTIPIGVLALLVTLSVMVKGQQITDIFMELNTAPTKWRWLLLSYVILVPLILATIIYI